jgi:Fe2+ transport system protein FeoA
MDFLRHLTMRMEASEKDGLALATLRSGAEGLVLRIEDPQLKLALMRIGLLEGDKFCVAELAPLGGPIALRVRGGKVAMRRTDAQKVLVKLL